MANVSKRWGSARMFPGRIKAAIKAAEPTVLVKCATVVERAAKESVKQGGAVANAGGKYAYYNSDLKRVVMASKPPKPPHVQTGTLRSSIQSALTPRGAIVGPTEKYGKYHEFGTRIHAARPFMRPALRRSAHKLPVLFKGML